MNAYRLTRLLAYPPGWMYAAGRGDALFLLETVENLQQRIAQLEAERYHRERLKAATHSPGYLGGLRHPLKVEDPAPSSPPEEESR